MTPKEKAEKLVKKYRVLARFSGGTGDTLPASKECALIAVDEVFEFMKMDDDHHEDAHFANSHWVDYWVNVKQEIEKL